MGPQGEEECGDEPVALAPQRPGHTRQGDGAPGEEGQAGAVPQAEDARGRVRGHRVVPSVAVAAREEQRRRPEAADELEEAGHGLLPPVAGDAREQDGEGSRGAHLGQHRPREGGDGHAEGERGHAVAGQGGVGARGGRPDGAYGEAACPAARTGPRGQGHGHQHCGQGDGRSRAGAAGQGADDERHGEGETGGGPVRVPGAPLGAQQVAQCLRGVPGGGGHGTTGACSGLSSSPAAVGSRTSTVVPAPGELSMRNRPPALSTRM
ncbi:hypothetical protein GCM10020221_31690 [Streptomyces thioluteus]|uniref:Uncharacterized protein n=1 Tax=Streptomyces thioluteus TaxID=66431 RepID=A0ABP6JHI8_STRTU